MEENINKILETNNPEIEKASPLFPFIKNFIIKLLLGIRNWLIDKAGYILIVVLIFLSVWAVQPIQRLIARNIKINSEAGLIPDEKKLKNSIIELEKTTEQAIKKYERLTPQSNFIIINSSLNEFSLYKNKEVVRQGRCSTGSYVLLKKGDEQKWMFKTPKGMFTVQGKITNPVWHKPDWAFVEEGLPVPPPRHPSRYEYGVLGDYALSLGDGYLIHGTLYQRLLGLPVTHGCVRLGDEDLEAVYNHLSIGSRVIIY